MASDIINEQLDNGCYQVTIFDPEPGDIESVKGAWEAQGFQCTKDQPQRVVTLKEIGGWDSYVTAVLQGREDELPGGHYTGTRRLTFCR